MYYLTLEELIMTTADAILKYFIVLEKINLDTLRESQMVHMKCQSLFLHERHNSHESQILFYMKARLFTLNAIFYFT